MLDGLLSILIFISGFLLGSLFVFFFRRKAKAENQDFLKDLVLNNKEQQQLLFETYMGRLQNSFKAESLDNLQRSTETTYKLTSKQLEQNQKAITDEISSNRGAIEKNISLMLEKVSGLGDLVHKVEKQTGQSYGELGTLLKQTNEQTKSLVATTSSIKDVLSNSQSRGLFGERIAEDILKHSGFIENIHYKKQVTLESGGRPDFSFLLPEDLLLHMDVKFPLDNYKKYLSTKNSEAQKRLQKAFVADVKTTMKSLLSRSYIDPDKTVDCVLLFIPHEDVISFVQEKSPELIEESLKKHVILCSPMSLLSVLMVVKKAVETFKIQKTSQEIVQHMNIFKKQWQLYTNSFDGLGKKIKDLEGDYEKLVGTRTRLLGSIVDRISKLQ